MPNITAGNVITDTAQILPGVIVNSDISASAAIDYSKLALALGIVNADISATAAIVDTKLATIATAGKVSGAALTLLANIPAGAGLIPAANLPSAPTTNKSGLTTKDTTDANTTQTIAHGLGATPNKIKLLTQHTYNAGLTFSFGVFDASGQRCTKGTMSAAAHTNDTHATAAIVLEEQTTPSSNFVVGTVSVDATNISITWVKTGTPNTTQIILWEAIV